MKTLTSVETCSSKSVWCCSNQIKTGKPQGSCWFCVSALSSYARHKSYQTVSSKQVSASNPTHTSPTTGAFEQIQKQLWRLLLRLEIMRACTYMPRTSCNLGSKGVWTHAGVRSFMTCPSSHDKRFKAFRCKKWKLRWLEAVHSHSDGAFIVRHKRDWGLFCRLTGVNTDTWKLTADRLPGFITGHNVITLS